MITDEEFLESMTDIADQLGQYGLAETNAPNEDFDRLWRMAGLIVNNRKEGEYTYVSVSDFKLLVITSILNAMNKKPGTGPGLPEPNNS
jgi:hypothetical protein